MVRRTPVALTLVALGSMVLGTAWAQSVISAHSGVVHLTEGTVELDGTAIVSPARLGEFTDVKVGQTLATKDGDAEVLLTPGVFLRLAENSSFKMVSNKLADTRVEVLTGSAMLQVSELLQGNAITVLFHNADIELAKRGLYRLDSDPARLRVYDGDAKVSLADANPIQATKGHQVVFDDLKLEAKNFDTKETDAFYRWNERRDEYLAQANISAAKSARDSGMGFNGSSAYNGYGGYGYAGGMGSWMFNPWFGMFTYMPYGGMMYSPFGFGYYSPYSVGSLYMPGSPYYYGGTGYAGVTRAGVPTTFGTGLAGATTRASLGSTGLRGAGPMGGGVGNSGVSSSSAGRSSGGGLASAGGHGGGGGGHK